jgi:hypothetical protein
MRTYKDWPLLEKIPDGWRIDKSAGSPLSGYEFVTNGKSILTGLQKRALLKVRPPAQKLLFDSEWVVSKMEIPTEIKPEPEIKKLPYVYPAKTVNDLARKKFKQQLLKDILVDLTICEIESWSKTEYINELKCLINSIGNAPA